VRAVRDSPAIGCSGETRETDHVSEACWDVNCDTDSIGAPYRTSASPAVTKRSLDLVEMGSHSVEHDLRTNTDSA
jgi:hypothetical protein